ncbi:MAG: D-2-hydroxyacid dehydrogenase family protein [Chloroflexi bacterium]|nr:D-2-hydroxyacid dehydrogenase family protein [Chloroflexota bacterium]
MVRVAILDDYQGVAKALGDWSILPPEVHVHVFQDHLADEEALVERLKRFEVVVGMRERTPFPRSLLERLPVLKLLVTTGMANSSFDLEAATDLGILVTGTNSDSATTAELTWGLIMALTRRIAEEDKATRAGRWQTTIGPRLGGKTLGVLGLGHIGSQVAAYGRAFQMSVVAWSQNLTPDRAAECGATLVSKEELFAGADVLSIHVRLSGRTRGLVTSHDLGLMKPSAYLVNTSRGPIVDEAALIDVLHRKAIAGAALDVFDKEPLPLNHPLLHVDNTVITPHLGYVTTESYRVMYSEAAEDIRAFLSGRYIRIVNPEVVDRPNLRRLD